MAKVLHMEVWNHRHVKGVGVRWRRWSPVLQVGYRLREWRRTSTAKVC